jgi:hypothetical protein
MNLIKLLIKQSSHRFLFLLDFNVMTGKKPIFKLVKIRFLAIF